MKRGRWATFKAWLYAATHSYFWMPCPICGVNFGGHESADDSLMDSWSSGRGVCLECGPEAARRAKEFCKANPPPVRVIQVQEPAPIQLGPGAVGYLAVGPGGGCPSTHGGAGFAPLSQRMPDGQVWCGACGAMVPYVPGRGL